MSKKMPWPLRVKGTDPCVSEQMLNVVPDEDKTKEQLLEEVLRLRRRTCEMEASQSELARKVEAAREAEKRCTAVMHDKVEEVREPGERYYRALIENATDCVHVMKTDGTILYESPSVARLFGYQPGQQIGKSGFAFVHLEDIPALREALDHVVKDPAKPVVVEFRMLDADGSWRNVETVARNLLDDPMVGGIVINTRDVTERKRMEEALRHSEKKLRFMFENARDAVILIDRNSKVVDIGGTAQNLLGYNPQTFIGVGLAEFGVFEEKELVRIAEIFKEAVKGGEIRGLLQTVVKRKDGSLVPVEVSTRAVEDNGSVEAFLCILRDISERKRAEEALQESEERFRTLIENISDAIMVLEWDGTIRYDSPSIRRVLSYEPQELVGTNIFELIHPEDRERAHEALGPSFMDVLGAQVPLDLRMRHKDGSFGIMEGLVQNLLGDPKVQGILVNCRDITERKSIEEALQQSEEKLRTIFDNASDVLLYLDNGGRVLDINNKIESVIGYTRDELVGVSFSDLDVFGPGGGQMASRLFTEFVQGETAITLIELDLKHKDGSMVPVEVSTKPIVKDGKVLGQLNVIRDIRERKEAEASLARYAAELTRSNAELEQFAYIASHDLQEPLRTVRSYVQLLARRYQGKLDSDADEFIGYAVDGVGRMQALINGLLAYSRVSTRGGEFKPVDCEALLDRSLANLQMAIEDSKAVVTHDPMPTVTADELQLGQVFQNLISNALKFHAEQPPHVHISAENKAKEWVFSVRDDGIGIEPQYFQRLFIIFQRLRRQEEYPGTGMGLAVCKKIVERHGGRIWMESEPGRGSTFYFTMPELGGKQP